MEYCKANMNVTIWNLYENISYHVFIKDFKKWYFKIESKKRKLRATNKHNIIM